MGRGLITSPLPGTNAPIVKPDRVVHVLIGEVADDGPHEAPLGAALRIAFRALTLAGVHDGARMHHLERVLRSERSGSGICATALTLQISPDNPRLKTIRAGHPGMLLHGGGTVEWIMPPAGRRWDCAPTTGHNTSWNCRMIRAWCW